MTQSSILIIKVSGKINFNNWKGLYV